MNKDQLLFMNNLAIKFFEKHSFIEENENYLNSQENVIKKTEKENSALDDTVYSYFKNLKLIDPNYTNYNGKGKSLYEILLDYLNDKSLNSHFFSRIGYFSDEISLLNFEVLTRKLKFKQDVLEIF
jgi:hypothetical protein